MTLDMSVQIRRDHAALIDHHHIGKHRLRITEPVKEVGLKRVLVISESG
jgi:hypothetical protein